MTSLALKRAFLLGVLALAACEEDDPDFVAPPDSGSPTSTFDAAAQGGGTQGGGTQGGGTQGGGTQGGDAAPVTPGSGADAGPGATPGGGSDASIPASDAGSSSPDGGPASTGAFPPVSDFAQAGPFGNTLLSNVGPDANYTVYMPEKPAPSGAKFPLVGWMSGGATTHDWYTLLPHLASHGFVVVTSNAIPGIGEEAELGRQIIAGLDWAIAEHARQGSQLAGKLDTTKIAAAGYSMGSLATFTIAADKRLTTTVHISGGNMAPEPVRNLHAPAAFICGTPNPACTPLDILSEECDIAAANCDTDFAGANTPVFYANFPGGHLGIMTSPHQERISAMTAAWLRQHLMGDTSLKRLFVGPSCTYCSDPNWKVQQKNLN